ncbi:rhodanese-like domain protein [Mycobacterium intracellulare]|nr:rhodanese-like domain protein [Mycobacterium intracellulare]
MQARDRVLISATELAGVIETGDPVSVLDVRWRIDETDGRAAYLEGHIPGAVYVSLEDELSDHSISGRGRHPCRRAATWRSPRAAGESGRTRWW